CRIIDIAVEDPGDIALIEDAAFCSNHLQHQLGPGSNAPGIDPAARFMLCKPFQLNGLARTFCLAHHGGCAHTDMGGCHEPETALCMGAAIDADVETGKCQMPVLQVKPGLALLEELWLVTGPQAIADLARRPA